MPAVPFSTSRRPVFHLSSRDPSCLVPPWIWLPFHHSLMSSCSCQHLLAASNSWQHNGSWDPRDKLQSAVCRGGFTPSQANQGKHPLPRGRAFADRLSPSYPVITLPLPLCCKLLLWMQSAETQTLWRLLCNLFNIRQQQPKYMPPLHSDPTPPPQKKAFFTASEHLAFCVSSGNGANVSCRGFRLFSTWRRPWGELLRAFPILLESTAD